MGHHRVGFKAADVSDMGLVGGFFVKTGQFEMAVFFVRGRMPRLQVEEAGLGVAVPVSG